MERSFSIIFIACLKQISYRKIHLLLWTIVHSIVSIRSQLETLFSIVNTKLVFLPPYSPDLSPIENSFGKIKLSLKNHNITNQDELYVAMLESIATVTPENIRGWYSHCGYHY